MRVLLIGGRGFIGSHLALRLQQGGDEVWPLGRDEDFVPFLVAVDAVVHLACETTPGMSLTMPTRELGNLALGLRLAEALLRFPHVRLLFVSSGGTVYGDCGNSPAAEDTALAPLSFHGAGKAALELFFGVLRREGREVTLVRPANAYGPGQNLKSGFGFIRTLLQYAHSGETMTIWGDGEAVRDFVYVSDVAEAIARLLRRDASGAFNIGSGEGCSLNQVLQLAREVTGREIAVRYEAPRGGDVSKSVLDISALSEVLSWQPGVSLPDGLRRSWEAM